MSIWRAPLLIIGILIILLAAAALAAPWLVDWNRYKPQLSAWGSALTGREVRIGGEVDFRLFPWPAARLHDITVAGVEGGRFPHLLKAEALEARFSLAALLSGRLEVESIRLIRPQLALEHLGDGRGNWQLNPRANIPLPLSPDRVTIDSVRVENGRILLADYRARGVLRITNARLTMEAPTLSGPWRLQGTWRLLARQWRVRASTGKVRGNRPVSISLRMEPPAERSGHVLKLNGELRPEKTDGDTAPGFEGEVFIAPVLGGGRGDLLDPARMLTLKARLLATPDLVELRDIRGEAHHAASSPFQSFNGKARLVPGQITNLSILLRTPRLRLDERLVRLLGLRPTPETGQRGQKTSPGEKDGLALLRYYLRALAGRTASLPPNLLVELDLATGTLEVNGGAFTGASLTAEVTPELFAIHHLRAELPAASLTFRGDLLGGDLLQLTGELEVKAADARRLLFALSPRLRTLLADAWQGAPGKLELLATIDLADHVLRMVSRRLYLDEQEASLDWRQTILDDGTTRNDLRLQVRRLDLDRHFGASARRGAAHVLRVLAQRLLHEHAGALAFHLEADELRLADTPWRGLRLEIARMRRQLELKTLRVENIAGLRLSGQGLFRATAEHPWLGNLSLHLRGKDAAALWRLAGALQARKGTTPEWLARLGAVDLGLELALDAARDDRRGNNQRAGKPDSSMQFLRLALTGRAGPAALDIHAEGEAALSALPHGRWKVRADVKSDRIRALLALAGLNAPLPERGEGGLDLRLDGVPKEDMQASLNLHLPGATLRYEGQLRLTSEEIAPRALAGAGALTVKLGNARPWLRLARLHVPENTALSASAQAAFSARTLNLRQLRLRVNDGIEVAGDIRIAFPEPDATAPEGPTAQHAHLSGQLSASRLNLRHVLALLLAAPDDARRLRADPAAGLALDVETRADEISLPAEDWRLAPARLRITHDGAGELSASLSAGRGKPKLRARVDFRRTAETMQTTATLHATLPLVRVLRPADARWLATGEAELRLRATGQATTMRGLLAALKGGGTALLRKARIEGLSPHLLLKRLRALKREEELKNFDQWAVEALHAGQWPLPEETELKLDLQHGLVELLPFEWTREGIRTRLSGLMDLFRRQMDLTLEFIEQGRQAAPLFSVAFSGPPTALRTSHDVALLREWIQQELIRRKMEELKRLERERAEREEAARRLEQKLREEEERRQRETAERLQQQAQEMHRRLQEVLQAIYRQEQERQRQANEANAQRQEDAPAPSKVKEATAAPAAQGADQEGPSALSIEALIRQAEREEQEGATTPPSPPRSEARTPPTTSTQAASPPQAGVPVPQPRKRPSRTTRPRPRPKSSTTRRPPAVKRPKSRPRTAMSGKKAQGEQAKQARQAGQTRQERQARQEKQGAPRKKAQSQPVPLVNWNKLAPPPQ